MRASYLFGTALIGVFFIGPVIADKPAYGIDPAAEQPPREVPAPLHPQAAERGFVEPKPGRGNHHPNAGWYLGVYGTYTDTGLSLTEVFPGTSAARAGLEPGDRIVAVGGYQIGILANGRLNLDTALQRYTRTGGWVRLLVQDHRTKRLINMDVRLTRGRVHT